MNSGEPEVGRPGLRRPAQILHFITVVDVRRARGDERVASAIKKNCMSPQFGMSDGNEVTRGLSSNHSQQLFSAIILLWSGVGGQLLSSCCCGQGLVVSYYSSCCCGQGLVVSYYHHVAVVRGWWSAIIHHVAVVRGWWSAIWWSSSRGQELLVIVLWSGVASHRTVVTSWWSSCCGHWLVVSYYSSCCCGQGLVVSYLIIILLWSRVGGQLFDLCLTVVRNWWSSCCGQELVVMLLWSGVGGQLCTRSLEGRFRNAWGRL